MPLIIIAIVLILSVGGGTWYYTSWERLEPGFVGILVDNGTGTVRKIDRPGWVWVGRYQQLVEWPIGDQEYVMEKGDGVGQIAGDDAIECRTADMQPMKFDVQTGWKIDPERAVATYQARRNIPLVGIRNRDKPGNYLEDLVIRIAMRDSVVEACSRYGWEELLGEGIQKFNDDVTKAVKSSAEPDGVIIRNVRVIRPYPNPKLDEVTNARLEGKRQAEQQRFNSEQAARQATIDQAASNAAALKAKIDAESKAALDTIRATADADVKKIAALQEAAEIESKGKANAAAIKAQAEAVTKELVELERVRRWNGQGPTTVLGSDTQIINQIPR